MFGGKRGLQQVWVPFRLLYGLSVKFVVKTRMKQSSTDCIIEIPH